MTKQKETIKKLKEEIVKLKEELKPTKKKSNGKFVKDIICNLCGDAEEELQSHHLISRELIKIFFPNGIEGLGNKRNLITVCKSCHMFLHCNPKVIMRARKGHSDAIKQGLDTARKLGRPIGRQFGSKDKKSRSKEGYFLRWELKEN
jgi:hypothetical protein